MSSDLEFRGAKMWQSTSCTRHVKLSPSSADGAASASPPRSTSPLPSPSAAPRRSGRPLLISGECGLYFAPRFRFAPGEPWERPPRRCSKVSMV